MKHQFLKSVLVLGSALAIAACSDATDALDDIDTSAQQLVEDNGGNSNISAQEPCYLLNADQPYLIYPVGTVGIVTDLNGQQIGTMQYVEGSTSAGTIVGSAGNVILEYVDTSVLPATTREMVTAQVPASSAAVTDPNPQPLDTNATTTPTSSAVTTANSSSSATNTTVSSSSESKPESSSSVQQVVSDGKITITGNLTQTVAQNAKTSAISFSGVSSAEKAVRKSWNAYFLNTEFNDGVFTIKATTIPDYFQTGKTTETFEIEGKSYEVVLNVTQSNGQQSNDEKSSSSQQQAKSSSSQQQPKSSSSQQARSSSSVKSSSSVAKSSSSQNTNLSGDEAKYVDAGKGGKPGFATRYWDCCKPHCAWPGNGTAKTCDASGNPVSSGATSMCDGGNAGICMGQIPIVVSDKLAYAFAAAPAAIGGQCGKCYALTFTGKGKYETKGNHSALLGKTLVVMISNIGGDVDADGGQFDIMIPGGGVGLYNGCSKMGWSNNMGAQYGGLLSDCESEVGYAGNVKDKRKECLTNKCKSVFSSNKQAQEGCLFLANWMEAAGNPKTEYKEVECPSALKNKY